MNSLLDIVLFPARWFKRLTDKRWTLYFGFVFIGIVDLVLHNLLNGFDKYFIGKPAGILAVNVAITVLFILLLGLMDVLFFSIPLFDLFKFFKRADPAAVNGVSLVKVAKVYIMAHFIIVPVDLVLSYVFRGLTEQSNYMLLVTAAYTEVLAIVWFSGIITRGMHAIFKFDPIHKMFAFMVVFVWNFIWGSVLSYGIHHWVMALYR